MPDPKQQYVDRHIDDPDLCKDWPNYKDRLHELERQFSSGKLTAGAVVVTPEPEPEAEPISEAVEADEEDEDAEDT